MLRYLLSGAAWLALSAAASAGTLSEDAKAFGARESLSSVEISPSGTRLLFLSPGAGRSSSLRLVDLKANTTKTLAVSDGDPESLRWCKFGSDDHLVCRFGGYTYMDSDVIGFSRLITLPVAAGGKAQQLGQRESFYNPVLRQFDGDILDWLPDRPGSILMARNYAGERFREGSNIRTRLCGDPA